ncbi:hypothetical protein [Micromonospora sp. WMMD812]|uniref:hypothetical protein n=1 Tax=Micromonospora sp. WMMD812 TaxID=3015152 RepID=UPI00248C5D15|nr:hypothetical protein [Micromonospora sp. WMMD812]WBB65788.1 hypothetical protein O7603_21660 [Micromonospora sp. WMMD812]
MTAGRFREVDHDLLADYLGGVLDGTPEETEVARLVAEDAAWAEAYALLASAVTDVRADLARWGEPVVELPATVADRITAALAALPPLPDGLVDADAERAGRESAGGRRPAAGGADTAGSAVVAAGDATDHAGPETEPTDDGPRLVPAQGGAGRRRPAAGVPRSEPGRGAATGPGRRRRRWARVAGPVAVAAASLAVVGLGVNQLARHDGETTGTAMDQPASAPEAAAAGPVRTTGPALRSGTDYTPLTLAAPASAATSFEAKPFASEPPGRQSGVDADRGRLPAPDGSDQLARLTDQSALNTCLNEIAAEHGAGPLVVELIDYAAFQGQQALVVRFADGTGARWAWVSGPECGVPGSAADTRFRTRVG